MTNHRAPEPNYPALGTITGLTMAGLACLGCILGMPAVDALVVAAKPATAQPRAAAPPLFTVPVKPALALTDFSRMSGDTDREFAAPSTGARAHSAWGDAPELHHREGHAHDRWTAPAADGRDRGVRDRDRLHGAHRAEPGRHRHLDGHHAERHAGRHGDSGPGRHHRDDGHVGAHHQGAHSHGGHHAR